MQIIPNKPWVKKAGTETTVEQSLADLAYAQLSARAPRLLKYAVAFQILDQNQDRTKAVGIFGFKVGDRWLRVPVFYNKNEIGGTELLMPTPDTFVPLNDQWVNLYVDGTGGSIGQGIDKGRTDRSAVPQLWQLRTPPTKWASDKELVNDNLLRCLAEVKDGTFNKVAADNNAPGLLDVCADNPHMMAHVNTLVVKFPWFKEALVRHCGTEKLAAALEQMEFPKVLKIKNSDEVPETNSATAGVVKKKSKPSITVIRVSRISIFTTDANGGIDFPTEDKMTLMRGKNVYRDERPDEEITNVIDWAPLGPPTGVLNPPSGTHLCHVLNDKGETDECLVCTNPYSAEGSGGKGEYGQAVVISTSDKSFANCQYPDIWVKSVEQEPALNKFISSLPEAGKPSSLDGHFVLVAPNGAVTLPMRAGDSLAGGNTSVVYCGCSGVYNPKGLNQTGGLWADKHRQEAVPNTHGEFQARISYTANDKTDQFYVFNGTLYYPKGTKVIRLKCDVAYALGDWPLMCNPRSRVFNSDKLTVKASADNFEIVDGSKTHQVYGKTEAEADLVERWNFRADVAEKLVKQAVDQVGTTVLIKRAAPYRSELEDGGPNAPNMGQFQTIGAPGGFADNIVPTQAPVNAAITIDDLVPNQSNSEFYRSYPQEYGTSGLHGIGSEGAEPGSPDQDSALMAQLARASQSGRKDLFETTALLTLLKYTPVDSILNKVMLSLKKNINEMGKLLGHIQWNRDQWGERYGRNEVGPLLDRIRDQFTNSGDLFLMFKEKSNGSQFDAGVIPDVDVVDEGQHGSN